MPTGNYIPPHIDQGGKGGRGVGSINARGDNSYGLIGEYYYLNMDQGADGGRIVNGFTLGINRIGANWCETKGKGGEGVLCNSC